MRSRGAEEMEEEPRRVTVWAHDLTAEAGSTYRYRLRVAVLNPLYQRHNNVVEQQKPLADRLALESLPTKWTEPIEMHRKTYFFLVKGSRRGQDGVVEIYRRYEGGWERGEFDVGPGEPIGGVKRVRRGEFDETEVDMSVPAIAVDVDADAPSMINPNRKTVKIVYLDTETDRLMERTTEDDENNPMRIRLRNVADRDERIDEELLADLRG